MFHLLRPFGGLSVSTNLKRRYKTHLNDIRSKSKIRSPSLKSSPNLVEPCMKPRGPHCRCADKLLSLKSSKSDVVWRITLVWITRTPSELEMSWMMCAVEPAATDGSLCILVVTVIRCAIGTWWRQHGKSQPR